MLVASVNTDRLSSTEYWGTDPGSCLSWQKMENLHMLADTPNHKWNSYAGLKDPLWGFPPKVCRILIHRIHSTFWHTHTFKCSLLILSFFNYLNPFKFFLSFLATAVNGLRRPYGLGHFDFKPSPTEELLGKCFRLESGQFLCSHKQSLPRTTKAKLASLLHAAHQWQETPTKDSKVRLVAKLGLQDCILQERSPGMHTQALSQKGALSGCRHHPH